MTSPPPKTTEPPYAELSYAELAVTSNYSFLTGASHPDELVTAAAALGLSAMGIADRNSLAGVVRAHVAAKSAGLRLVVGARLVPRDGPEILCYPTDRAAYGRLCRLLTIGRRRAEKGDCEIYLAEILAHGDGQLFIVMPDTGAPELTTDPSPNTQNSLKASLRELTAAFANNCWLAATRLYQGSDKRRLDDLHNVATAYGIPLLATNDVLMHHPGRKAMLDLVTCIRQGCTIDEAGYRLAANGERHLKAPAVMAELFRDYPDALAQSLKIVERCRFSLEDLRYEYPEESLGDGSDKGDGDDGNSTNGAQAALTRLTWAGAKNRYPAGLPEKVKTTLDHELALIEELDYAPYFLTVYDLVRFARGRGILCQGRGSAANSAVCYCLGITAVDPSRLNLLFERFVSSERNEPPDIDVDFEHARREEVIQYIYEKYGRDRAGLAATVVCYRSRGAIRDVGKAMGLSPDTISALAGSIWGWGKDGFKDSAFDALGLDLGERRLGQTLALAQELIGFPRHLSQHVGGFVMTRGPLCEVVPIENAAMPDRTVIEWDKDDLDALGILKVDVLALGMLTCLKKGFDLLSAHLGKTYELATVPNKDSQTYDMLCAGDSIGVFQVESRAQMSMLPRLKPRDFYDLVIEVAIVRPGPIQGDMVHPYLRRRNGEEKVSFPSDALREVLGKTLGVPLFQEQAMQIAIVGAGFSPAEADQLRRAMATFKRGGQIHKFEEKLIDGMVLRGYDRDFAERCFHQIEGFGTYGFPESHAASFALLVYVSAWMKCHHPAVFACALLNSQPMGFYAPAQIVRDARDHDVEVRPVDINHSLWDCTLEPALDSTAAGSGSPDGLALRLGLRQVKGLAEDEAARLLAGRANGYPDPLTLWRRAGVKPASLEALARADAFGSMGLSRREALWALKGLPLAPLPLFAAMGEEERGPEPHVQLPKMTEGEEVAADYASLRLSLKAHPLSFLRAGLAAEGRIPAAQLKEISDGTRIDLAGLVLVRQRPGSAKGVIFATLEDETGVANVIVWPDRFERYRPIVLGARLLAVRGKLQKEGLVIHIVADELFDLSERLYDLTDPARRSQPLSETMGPETLARADEVKRPPRTLPTNDVISHPRFEPPHPIRHPRNVNPMPRSRDFR